MSIMRSLCGANMLSVCGNIPRSLGCDALINLSSQRVSVFDHRPRVEKYAPKHDPMWGMMTPGGANAIMLRASQ